jgi:ubiquinol-cytochrome c reductase cytochrome b subunit
VLRDVVACLAVLLVVVFFVLRYRGADLGAPADPSEQFSAARPDWYFLFLFQFLKYFPGGTEVWGAVIIPGLLLLVLAVMPFVGKWRLGHRFNVGYLWVMLGGAGLLTLLAVKEDQSKAGYVAAVEIAKRDAARVVVLAQSPEGIPPLGAVTLLRNDPLTQGPKLFAKNCASCHRFDGHDGLGGEPTDPISASDLKGFGSREWLTGFFDPERIDGPQYYGGTEFKDGKMVRFVKEEVAEFSPAEKEQLRKTIVALSAEARLVSQSDADRRDADIIADGRELLVGDIMNCAECHRFHDAGEDATGPDLTGFGSREWLMAFIANPEHERFFGERNDRMPVFGDKRMLTAHEIGLIADWLRGEWYEK